MLSHLVLGRSLFHRRFTPADLYRVKKTRSGFWSFLDRLTR